MFIVSTGLTCSVGLSAAAACAALRAGIAKFDELPYSDSQGKPIIGAVVPGVDLDANRGPRLVEILKLAIADCLGENPTIVTEKVPLLIGLPEQTRPKAKGLAEGMLQAIQESLGMTFHPAQSQAIPLGHTSGFEGLRIARNLLQNAQTPACLVCGVDSFINWDDLDRLEGSWRLKNEANADGIIPGEAGAAVLLMKSPPEKSPRVSITGLGFSEEKAHILSGEPLLGIGLAEAVRAALTEAGLAMHQIDFRLSDVAGEQYGFKEQAILVSRTMRQRRPDFPMWHHADSIGDIGAAAGVAELVIATHAFSKGYAPGKRALACTSAVAGGRAAAVIRSDL